LTLWKWADLTTETRSGACHLYPSLLNSVRFPSLFFLLSEFNSRSVLCLSNRPIYLHLFPALHPPPRDALSSSPYPSGSLLLHIVVSASGEIHTRHSSKKNMSMTSNTLHTDVLKDLTSFTAWRTKTVQCQKAPRTPISARRSSRSREMGSNI
jgi:hypothetical protein